MSEVIHTRCPRRINWAEVNSLSVQFYAFITASAIKSLRISLKKRGLLYGLVIYSKAVISAVIYVCLAAISCINGLFDYYKARSINRLELLQIIVSHNRKRLCLIVLNDMGLINKDLDLIIGYMFLQ